MANGESKSLRKLTIPLTGGLDVTGRERERLVDGGHMLRDMRNVMISKGHIVPLPEFLDLPAAGIKNPLVNYHSHWNESTAAPDAETAFGFKYQYGTMPGEVPISIWHMNPPGQYESGVTVNPAPSGGGFNADGFTQNMGTFVLTSKTCHFYYGSAYLASLDDRWQNGRMQYSRTLPDTIVVVNGSEFITSPDGLFDIDSSQIIDDSMAVAGGWIVVIKDAGGFYRQYEVKHVASSSSIELDRPYEGASDTLTWWGGGGGTGGVIMYATGGGGAYLNEYSYRASRFSNGMPPFPNIGSFDSQALSFLWAGRTAGGGAQLQAGDDTADWYNTAVCGVTISAFLSYGAILFSRFDHQGQLNLHDTDQQLYDISGLEILPSAQVVIAGAGRITDLASPQVGLFSARIWHSDISRPYLWNDPDGTGGVIDLINMEGPIFAFKKLANQYCVHFRRGIMVGYYTGDPYQPLEYRETFADIGALCPRTLLTIDGQQFFLGHDYRCHMFDGQRTRPINQAPLEALVPIPVNELRYCASAVYDDVNRQVWLLVSPYSRTRADKAAAAGKGKSFALVWDIQTNQWSRPIDTDWIIGCFSSPYRDPNSDDWLMGVGVSTENLSDPPSEPGSMYQVMRLVDSSWWKSPYRFVSQDRQEFHRANNESSFTMSALDFQEVDVDKVVDHIDMYITRFYVPSDREMTVELRLNINGDTENYISDTQTLTETENTSVDEEKIIRFFFDAESFEQATLTTILEGGKEDFHISGAIEKFVIYYQVLSEDQAVN